MQLLVKSIEESHIVAQKSKTASAARLRASQTWLSGLIIFPIAYQFLDICRKWKNYFHSSHNAIATTMYIYRDYCNLVLKQSAPHVLKETDMNLKIQLNGLCGT